MPRTNKATERVFTDLSKTSIEEFLKIDEEMGLQATPTQAAMMSRYKALAEEADFIEVLDAIAGIEEIIVQLRCKQMISSELRLSLSRNYIYARSLFYRRGKEINDIRVVAGKTEQYGDNLEELLQDPIFRNVCHTELVKVMDREIAKNISNLNLIYANE
jgi:hypothetical protein